MGLQLVPDYVFSSEHAVMTIKSISSKRRVSHSEEPKFRGISLDTSGSMLGRALEAFRQALMPWPRHNIRLPSEKDLWSTALVKALFRTFIPVEPSFSLSMSM
jgi:hypothetical protein